VSSAFIGSARTAVAVVPATAALPSGQIVLRRHQPSPSSAQALPAALHVTTAAIHHVLIA
jgi:hypothetical protein